MAATGPSRGSPARTGRPERPRRALCRSLNLGQGLLDHVDEDFSRLRSDERVTANDERGCARYAQHAALEHVGSDLLVKVLTEHLLLELLEVRYPDLLGEPQKLFRGEVVVGVAGGCGEYGLVDLPESARPGGSRARPGTPHGGVAEAREVPPLHADLAALDKPFDDHGLAHVAVPCAERAAVVGVDDHRDGCIGVAQREDVAFLAARLITKRPGGRTGGRLLLLSLYGLAAGGTTRQERAQGHGHDYERDRGPTYCGGLHQFIHQLRNPFTRDSTFIKPTGE